MFCEPNLKNRDNIEAIKKSVSLPGTYRGKAAGLVGRVRTGRASLTQPSVKGQKFVPGRPVDIAFRLEFKSLRR
jgi:hypothetical protein